MCKTCAQGASVGLIQPTDLPSLVTLKFKQMESTFKILADFSKI